MSRSRDAAPAVLPAYGLSFHSLSRRLKEEGGKRIGERRKRKKRGRSSFSFSRRPAPLFKRWRGGCMARDARSSHLQRSCDCTDKETNNNYSRHGQNGQIGQTTHGKEKSREHTEGTKEAGSTTSEGRLWGPLLHTANRGTEPYTLSAGSRRNTPVTASSCRRLAISHRRHCPRTGWRSSRSAA